MYFENAVFAAGTVFQGPHFPGLGFLFAFGSRNRSVRTGMRLKIIQIMDRGVPGKECLHIAVQLPVDLHFYAVFDTARIGGGLISQFPAHTYWFQQQAVQPGDNVILYTGPGPHSFNKRADGGTNYFFYWGLDSTIWHEPSSCAVVLEVNKWETSPEPFSADRSQLGERV